jgi:hypothetical protein
MLGFDVARADWRDALRERAFRLGLLLLPAGERTLRFYARYDMEAYAIDEALAILRRAVVDVLRLRATPLTATGPEIRVGALECPLEAIEVLALTGESFSELRVPVMEVEADRYGGPGEAPAEHVPAGRTPLLQLPAETLEATLAGPGAVGLALRDGVSGRIVAYALGSALEGHDEEGVSADPRLGENDTFYLQAMATALSVQNQVELENHLLGLMRERVLAAGFAHLSALIEERIHASGPPWLKDAQVLQVVDDYLKSGVRFVYLHTALAGASNTGPTPAPEERRRSAS